MVGVEAGAPKPQGELQDRGEVVVELRTAPGEGGADDVPVQGEGVGELSRCELPARRSKSMVRGGGNLGGDGRPGHILTREDGGPEGGRHGGRPRSGQGEAPWPA